MQSFLDKQIMTFRAFTELEGWYTFQNQAFDFILKPAETNTHATIITFRRLFYPLKHVYIFFPSTLSKINILCRIVFL